eukprot:352968-Chlamydomonas_euryale.AAC.8
MQPSTQPLHATIHTASACNHPHSLYMQPSTLPPLKVLRHNLPPKETCPAHTARRSVTSWSLSALAAAKVAPLSEPMYSIALAIALAASAGRFCGLQWRARVGVQNYLSRRQNTQPQGWDTWMDGQIGSRMDTPIYGQTDDGHANGLIAKVTGA